MLGSERSVGVSRLNSLLRFSFVGTFVMALASPTYDAQIKTPDDAAEAADAAATRGSETPTTVSDNDVVMEDCPNSEALKNSAHSFLGHSEFKAPVSCGPQNLEVALPGLC